VWLQLPSVERTKEPVVAEQPEEVTPPYVPLYPPLPPAPNFVPSSLTSDGKARGTITLVKSSQKPLGPQLLCSPASYGLHNDSESTSSPPTSSIQLEDPSSPQTPIALQITLRAGKAQCIITRMVKYKEEGVHLSTSPLPPQAS
jgi:hypothetical protein